MATTAESSILSITEDEAALYDRQIRLWGLEAQQRMRNATIVVVNLKGVAAETVKNIVLAGVGTLLLFDAESVTEEDLGAGFLFRDEDVGMKRVDAAKPKIEALNPLVTVKTFCDTRALSDQSLPKFLEGVDLVCVTDSSRNQLLRFNDACRKSSTMFYAGGSYGFMGYIFVDLISHQHLAPDRTQKAAPGSQPKMTKQTASYPALDAALSSLKQTFGKMSKRQTKDVNPLGIFSILTLWEYQSKHEEELPDGHEAVDELERIGNALVSSSSVNATVLKSMPKTTAESLARTAAHEFSPICAVVGGLLAQDILKALAGREPPYANFLVFDGTTGSGTVVPLGMI